jgi:hypothetical protein
MGRHLVVPHSLDRRLLCVLLDTSPGTRNRAGPDCCASCWINGVLLDRWGFALPCPQGEIHWDCVKGVVPVLGTELGPIVVRLAGSMGFCWIAGALHCRVHRGRFTGTV